MSRFIRDSINTMLGGKPFFIYTLIRNSREADKLKLETEKIISELNKKESLARKEYMEAKLLYNRSKREALGGYSNEKEYLLAKNRYKTFEDFLADSHISTREEWERFAYSTRFFLFNEEYKKLHPEQYEQ